MATKTLRLRWAAECSGCGAELAAKTEVEWDSEAKTATCRPCVDGPPPIEAGTAGASARREYEKRSARELERKQEAVERDAEWRADLKTRHRFVGPMVTALTAKPSITPESQATTAWKDGAIGEERMGRMLEAIDGIAVLHDRRVPHSRANIDHLVVGPAGVFVIDPKNYEGAIGTKDRGGWFSPDVRLVVNGRDRTKLVDGVIHQRDLVLGALDGWFPGVVVRPVLCFVGANFRRLFPRPLNVRGVPAMWPDKVVEYVQAPGPLSAEDIDRVARRLADVFRPA